MSNEYVPGESPRHMDPVEQKRAAATSKLASELIDTGSQNITGYRPQPPQNRDQVNRNKELEQDIAQFIAEMFDRGLALDPRQMASARTHFEYALYHLNRAVFQPADPIGDVIKAGPNRG